MRRAVWMWAVWVCAAGCPGGEPAEVGSGESAATWEEVQVSCGGCHQAPSAEWLPKFQWDQKIPEMVGMPGPRPISEEAAARARAYYVGEAPASLGEAGEIASGGPVRFRREEYSPAVLEERRIPATAHVSFERLSSETRYDLIVSEMRSRQVFVLPWAPQARSLRPLAAGLNYPAHTELGDVSGDGRPDVLVASLGGLQPTNAREGSVSLLLHRETPGFDAHVLAEGLGRVCDVVGADFDGDGDVDVVAAAFGWRGPGELVVLEQVGVEGRVPQFAAPRVLDERDGFVSLGLSDVDGDGREDVVALLAQEHEQVVVFRNAGGLRFEPRVIHQAPTPSWGYAGLEVVDMDGDGDDDFLVNNGDALDDLLFKPYHGVSVLVQVGRWEFEEERVVDLHGCEKAVPADVDGDGDVDVVAVSFLPQHEASEWARRDLPSVVWVERTEAGWTPWALERQRCVHPTVSVADYDADGRVDIAVGNYVWIDQGATPGEGAGRSASCVTLFVGE